MDTLLNEKRTCHRKSLCVYNYIHEYVNTDASCDAQMSLFRQSGREIYETEREKENREKKREGVYLVKENNKI